MFVATFAYIPVVLVYRLLLAECDIVRAVINVLGIAACRLDIGTVVRCTNAAGRGLPRAGNALLYAIDLVGTAGRIIDTGQVVAGIIHGAKRGNRTFISIDRGVGVDVTPRTTQCEPKCLSFGTFIKSSIVIRCHDGVLVLGIGYCLLCLL